MRKYPVKFIDADNKEDERFVPAEMEERELCAEEFPEDGDHVQLGRRRGMKVIERHKVYGKKGLLRVEVVVSKRSLQQRLSDSLGAKASLKDKAAKAAGS